MGVVHEAERAEGDFRQRVAVKVLRQEAIAELPRFHIERQILANCTIRNRAPVRRRYDIRRPALHGDGVCRGRPITEYCVSNHVPLAARLQLFVQVCDAVAYAHRNLIVHRDLKAGEYPRHGGRAGQVARFRDREADRHRAAGDDANRGGAIDTARGGARAAARAARDDGYRYLCAWFVVVRAVDRYPALVACRGSNPQAVRVILDEPAPVPSRRAAENTAGAPFPARMLRGDFDAIVAKAVRKEPQHRYATVQAFTG